MYKMQKNEPQHVECEMYQDALKFNKACDTF